MSAVGGSCRTYIVYYQNGGCTGDNNSTLTNGIVNINGGGGVPCTFIETDESNDGNPTYALCIPNKSGSPKSGDTLTTTNPSGHAGDSSMSGTVTCTDNGACTVKLCPPQTADV